jgi:aspartyl-tRNA(Asn)/glutamyl-tRNA(Gln) amidotransferase subunit A
MIKEKIELIKSGKMTAEENIKSFLDNIKKNNNSGNKINAFIHVNENAVKEAKEIDKKIKKGKAGKLAGLAIAVKSNINVRGMTASCASNTLSNYTAAYDAKVIEKIKKEDGIIIGMTNMDEFACGSSGETSAYGPTKNPQALELIPGGSSSGSAAAVAADFCDISLGSDTGGSIRNPASHCGVVGLKPSYGLVSRYGLIDLSMSLDQIGPFSKDVYGAALMLSIIAGKDNNDPSTFETNIPDYTQFKQEKLRIGLSDNFKKLCSKEIYEAIEKQVKESCKKNGWQLVNVDLKHVDLAIQSYYILCYTEFFSATRKFDGRKYGFKIEEVCGPEVLRRILGGSEISKAEHKGMYYRRALKAMQLIKQDFDNAFKKVDVIISPTVPRLPHKIGSSITTEEMYGYDALTIPANLSGICAINIPAIKIKGIPAGIQIMAPAFQESRILNAAFAFEQ